jgi:hypothetical protein
MKNLLITLFVLVSNILISQTVIQFDNMETSSPVYLTAGWWTPAVTTGWFTNTSVSPTTSAVIYGTGTGTSANEQDWYSLPNVTGLNPLNEYRLKFRLSSRTFTSSTATTRGVDVGDFVDVQVSTNGGVTFISELRITGNNNATFPFTSTGVITHNANGSFTNSAAPTGDIYQSPSGASTTGPSTVNLNLPSGITQVAIDLFCRVNAAGEEWWIDNIELIETVITPLPIELIYFNGVENNSNNLLYWATASEKDNDYFTLERSTDGENWEMISNTTGAGNSQEEINYSYTDKTYKRGEINYYRLSQTDFNGEKEYFNLVAIDNSLNQKKVVKIINSMGQEVDTFYSNGIYTIIYDDGSVVRMWK